MSNQLKRNKMVNATKFVSSIMNDKYSDAHNHLKRMVEEKISIKIAQAAKKPFFK